MSEKYILLIGSNPHYGTIEELEKRVAEHVKKGGSVADCSIGEYIQIPADIDQDDVIVTSDIKDVIGYELFRKNEYISRHTTYMEAREAAIKRSEASKQDLRSYKINMIVDCPTDLKNLSPLTNIATLTKESLAPKVIITLPSDQDIRKRGLTAMSSDKLIDLKEMINEELKTRANRHTPILPYSQRPTI